MKSLFEISLSISGLWILSLTFLVLNFGLILMFPKYNLKKFTGVPKIKNYTFLNKISWYALFIISIFIPLKTGTFAFYIGAGVFFIGLLLYVTAMFYFAISEYHLPVTAGIYKFSKHPVYWSFFIIVTGMFLTTLSGFVFIIAILHFYSLYFIAKEEEKYCEAKYGAKYVNYKKTLKRSYDLK